MEEFGNTSYRAPLTVSNIFRLPNFPDLKLISGKEGLSKIIKNVSVYEVTDAYKWFRGNEFIITTFLSVPSHMYEEVFAKLAERNISGVVLCYPELYYGNVPESLINLSDKYSIPLFVAAKDVAYVDIIMPILNEIIGNDSLLHFKLKIVSEYNKLLLNGAVFSDVMSFIYRFLFLPLLVLDRDYEVVALQAKTDTESNDIMNLIQNLVHKYSKKLDEKKVFTIKNNQDFVTFYPIIANYSVLGYMAILGTEKLNAEASIVVEQGLETLAILFINRYARTQHYINLKNEVFTYITKSSLSEQELDDFKEKISLLGINKDDNLRLILININDYNNRINHNVQRRRFSSVREAIKKYFSRAICFENNNTYLLVLSTVSETRLESDITRFVHDIRLTLKNIKFKCIISPYIKNFSELRDSYKLVSKAGRISDILTDNSPEVVWAEKIEPLIYLSDAVKNNRVLYKWAERMLEPLINYDKEKKLGLTETAKAIFFENENLKQVSDKLFIHENTVLYRKKIIERLLGDNPFGKNKFFYTLALYIYTLENS